MSAAVKYLKYLPSLQSISLNAASVLASCRMYCRLIVAFTVTGKTARLIAKCESLGQLCLMKCQSWDKPTDGLAWLTPLSRPQELLNSA